MPDENPTVDRVYADGVAMVQLLGPQDRLLRVVELAAGDPALLAEVVGLANSVAAEHADGDFRLVFNTGPGAGQTVAHGHAHVLAGGLAEKTVGA